MLKRMFSRPEIGGSSSGSLRRHIGSATPSVTSVDGAPAFFCVSVPDGVRPGQEFQVYAGNILVRVQCPPDTTAGQSLRITVPLEQPNGQQETTQTGGGSHFPVTTQGQELMVTRIVPPAPLDVTDAPSVHSRDGSSVTENSSGHPPPPPRRPPRSPRDPSMQKFEVEVPMGVMPGQPFALLAGGVRVLVTCPVDARAGQRIRFKLPLALTEKPKPTNEAAAIKLAYDKDGWTRTIRVSDMKFQWVRMDDKGDIDTNTRFNAEKSAYVRTLDFRSGNDMRIRDGHMSLVPANEAFVDSSIEDLVSYADIAEAQVKDFEGKTTWFQDRCTYLAVEWNDGHVRINVRRKFLLEDSVAAIMSLNRRDFRKAWRFVFIGEKGIDAGGLKREWFLLVTEALFDPLAGLWQSSDANQMCMQINPASKFICHDYLVYYRFLGRAMGKALFDGELVAGHMVQYIYKHMLGWPITFKDIEVLDEEYYTNLKGLQKLASCGEDLSMLCLDFTTTVENMGAMEQVELVPGGKDIVVNNDNYPEYLEACLKFRMMGVVRAQLTELLLGFYDVVPEPLLTVFDFQELELLMCGLPTIDLKGWKQHTEYSGDYEFVGSDYPTCQWFWEVVEEFDQEMKARLLQFVTGTSGVPSGGFGVLQGNDGNIRKFTIHGVSVDTCLYPRAHTCFNRIDLPSYATKDDLRERLKLAVTMAATGFDIE